MFKIFGNWKATSSFIIRNRAYHSKKTQYTLLNSINKSEDYYSDKNIIAFKFFKDGNEISLFFDKKTLNLKGWQSVDLYQNLNIVYLSSIVINQKI